MSEGVSSATLSGSTPSAIQHAQQIAGFGLDLDTMDSCLFSHHPGCESTLHRVHQVPQQILSVMRLLQPLFLAVSGACLANSVTLDDLFTVKNAPGGGGCDGNQVNRLRQWATEAQTLTSAVLSGLNSLNTDRLMALNLGSFFGIHFRDLRASTHPDLSDGSQQRLQRVQGKNSRQNPRGPRLENQAPGAFVLVEEGQVAERFGTDVFQGVDDFLNQRTPGLLGAGRPWLFCDGTWLVEDDNLYDANGQYVTYIDQGQERNISIRKTNPSAIGNLQIRQWLLDMQQLTPEGECKNSTAKTNGFDVDQLTRHFRGMESLLLSRSRGVHRRTGRSTIFRQFPDHV